MILLLLFCTTYTYGELGYGIVIQKKLPRGLDSFIASYYGITPKIGEKLIIPFSRTNHCTATVESFKGGHLQGKLIDCEFDHVKEGQRLLLGRKKVVKKTVKKLKGPPIPRQMVGAGPLYLISGDLGTSTGIVSIDKSNKSPPGTKYTTESIMGAECEVVLIENLGSTGTIDSANCSFERDFYSGQKFYPLKD